MKKLSLGLIITIMLLSLFVILPSSVEAAQLSVDKTQMNVGEFVEVSVTTKTPVESMQFDLKFDNTKYQFVNDSVQSNLEYNRTNLINEKEVRVIAFDTNGNKTNKVALKFKAINTGDIVPFSVGGTIELGEDGAIGEKFENVEIKVAKIEKQLTTDNNDSGKQENVILGNQKQYLNEKGQLITVLPQTGEDSNIGTIKSLGIFKQLIPNNKVVPYALADSDNTVSISDVKNEYGEITTNASNPIKTGDIFNKNNIQYTTIIYGDINKDGKVTISDAIKIGKAIKGDLQLDEYQKEAADVENDDTITQDDLDAVVDFVLKLRVTDTDTIINKYPKEESQEYQLKNVKFENVSIDYDKQEHELTVTGLPEGIIVTYSNNKGTNAGEYHAVASFELSDKLKEEYLGVTPSTMEATLTINKVAYQLPENVKFESKTVVKDGNTHSLAVTGLPVGIVETYENNDKIEIGKYDVTARFELSEELSKNYSYVEPETMTAKLKIVDKVQPIGISLDGTTLATSDITMDLYTYNPNKPNVKDDGGYIYTIIPLKYFNEDNTITGIPGDEIGESISENDKKVYVLETGSEDMLWSYSTKKYISDGYGGYKVAGLQDNIEAIGIAVDMDNLTPEELNTLQGLTIKYYALNENDEQCFKEIKININVKSKDEGNKAGENNTETPEQEENDLQQNVSTQPEATEEQGAITVTSTEETTETKDTTQAEVPDTVISTPTQSETPVEVETEPIQTPSTSPKDETDDEDMEVEEEQEVQNDIEE